MLGGMDYSSGNWARRKLNKRLEADREVKSNFTCLMDRLVQSSRGMF